MRPSDTRCARWSARPARNLRAALRRGPGARVSGTPVRTWAPMRSGCAAARWTPTLPPKECPSTTTVSAISSRTGPTAAAYSTVLHAAGGAGVDPKPGRSMAMASNPSSTASKSRCDRCQPCSASTQGRPLPYRAPNKVPPANEVRAAISRSPYLQASRRPRPTHPRFGGDSSIAVTMCRLFEVTTTSSPLRAAPPARGRHR